MADYGKIRERSIKGLAGNTWIVQIWEKDHTGGFTNFNTDGEGFSIKWGGSGGTRDRVFIPSECTVNFIVENQTDEDFLYNIFEKGANYAFIRIYKNAIADANLWWFGWIEPGFSTIENAPFPYTTKLNATDSYVNFTKKKEKFFSGEADLNASSRVITNMGSDFSQATDLTSTATETRPIPHQKDWFRTAIDWWYEQLDYQLRDPWALIMISRGAAATGNSNPLAYKQADVYNGILKTFNAVGVLAEGFYHYIQPNSFVGNITGDIEVRDNNETFDLFENNYTLNTLLTIDGTTNPNKGTVLGGGSITHERPFEGVRATFNHGSTYTNITSGQDLSLIVEVGNIPSNVEGELRFHCFMKYYEEFDESEVTLSAGKDIHDHCVRTTSTVKVKIDNDNGTVRYLHENPFTNELSWSTSSSSVLGVSRGHNIQNISSFLITQNNAAIGAITNTSYNSGTPISVEKVGTKYKVTTYSSFSLNIPEPPTDDDYLVFIDVDSANNYWEGTTSNNSQVNITNPSTFDEQSTTAVDVRIEPITINEENDFDTELVYRSSQNDNTSYEDYDLDKMLYGADYLNYRHSVRRSLLTSGGIITTPITGGFQRGNPATDDFKNITQLLTNEYLEMQTEPLEILQADIFSADISPISYIKYSINDDANFKYYLFLGGTFNALSDTMSGEWYKVADSAPVVIEEAPEPTGSDSPPKFSTSPNSPINSLSGAITSNQSTLKGKATTSSNAVLTTELVGGTAYTSLSVSAIKGRLFKGQKVIISHANGSYARELNIDADAGSGSTSLTISSFTPLVDYPTTAVIETASYDLTNVLSTGSTAPITVKRTLTLSEYQNLNTTPVRIVDQPGTGKRIIPINVIVTSEHTSTETGNHRMIFGYDHPSTQTKEQYAEIRSFMYNIGGDASYAANPSSKQISKGAIENRRFEVYSTGAFNGNLDVTIYFTYQIMDV